MTDNTKLVHFLAIYFSLNIVGGGQQWGDTLPDHLVLVAVLCSGREKT